MEAWENNLLRHSFSFILIVVTKKRYYLLFSPLFSLARQSHLERKRKKSIGKGKGYAPGRKELKCPGGKTLRYQKSKIRGT